MLENLYKSGKFPQFNKLDIEKVEATLDSLIQKNREQIATLLTSSQRYTWDNLAQPIEDLGYELSRYWSVISHLNHVQNTPEIRKVYNACLPKLTEYTTQIGQNVKLFQAYQMIKENEEFDRLSQAQKKLIENTLRDFHLAGVDLNTIDKERFKKINNRLAYLNNKFEENVLDATDAWKKHITDSSQLSGIPEHVITGAKQLAEKNNLGGWLISLEFPVYFSVITFADNRKLRQEIYTAFVTRASDQGPHAGKWDNSDIMDEILKLRHDKALLLGFSNYADYSLATKMTKDSNQVLSFLNELAQRSYPKAQSQWQQLQAFAQQQLQLDELQAWDVAYASEKLRQHEYAIDQEQLRAYFPIEKVLQGLFTVTNKLYGIQVKKNEDNLDVWHKDVKIFDVYDENNNLQAHCYMDLYARSQKRGGAWMDSLSDRTLDSKRKLHLPIAVIVCNFASPSHAKPALLTHEEVVTLFHEFGHGLHQMLTQVNVLGVSGINNVAWDAVELPSQFMENWCWQEQALNFISEHYQTKETLPADSLKNLLKAKNFQSGMKMVRQLEFSLFDFNIHKNYDPKQGGRIQETLNKVRKEISVVPVPDFNRFQHGFSHIFGGGYAAGYFSYKWAEVLSSDAFTLFQENGIFDKASGQKFLTNILEKGGSEDAMELFIALRGRKPDIEALLKHSGID